MNASECDVQLCERNYEECNQMSWEVALISLNCLSAFVNSVHLFVLTQIQSLRGRAYLVVLQHIAIADIVSSVATCLRIACVVHIKATESRTFSAFVSVIDFTLVVKYYILAAACVERAKALSSALTYTTSPLINHISTSMALIWVYCFLIAIIRDVLFYDRLCINRVTGPGNLNAFEPSLMTTIEISIPGLITIIALIKVFREMTKMSYRSTSLPDQEIYAAAKYVGIITLVFFVCFTPTLMVFIGLYSGFHNVHFTSIAVLGHTIYGLMNTAIYGWLTRPYRKQLRTLVSYYFNSQNEQQVHTIQRTQNLYVL